jgi:hypothetical protein
VSANLSGPSRELGATGLTPLKCSDLEKLLLLRARPAPAGEFISDLKSAAESDKPNETQHALASPTRLTHDRGRSTRTRAEELVRSEPLVG